MKLYDNEWGFSIEHSNPFQLFPLLQAIALEHHDENEIIDLSRGDPGYGLSPSIRGREFMSYLFFLDTKLNHGGSLFAERKREQEALILEEIGVMTRSAFVPAVATHYLNDMKEFIEKCLEIVKSEGKDWRPFDVLSAIFYHSAVTGGTYLQPKGEDLIRMILAWWHKKTIKTPFGYDDLIFTSGASHAIGTLFKLLGQEGIQYLNPGDTVLLTSPVYRPYLSILQNRGISVVSLSINPNTGELEPYSEDLLKTLIGVKLMVLIDPNNPTGFAMSSNLLKRLADFAREQDSVVITDEVYSAFFEDRESLVDFCPERVLRIQARSKTERSTGLRFGDLLINPEANKYLTETKFRDLLPNGRDFKQAFLFAKGPGGIQGEFFHTTFVSGPSQFLGAAHILLGEEDRQKFRDMIRKNREVFCEALGLPHKDNRYYILFDLNEVQGSKKMDVPPEQKIVDLVKEGVVYLPSNLFFSEEDRDRKSRLHTVRASLANAPTEKIRQAAEITRRYLLSN